VSSLTSPLLTEPTLFVPGSWEPIIRRRLGDGAGGVASVQELDGAGGGGMLEPGHLQQAGSAILPGRDSGDVPKLPGQGQGTTAAVPAVCSMLRPLPSEVTVSTVLNVPFKVAGVSRMCVLPLISTGAGPNCWVVTIVVL